MSKIKFEVEIDATNGQQVLAVTNFLQAIGNTAEAATPTPKQETAKATTKAAELPKKEKAKAEETPKETAKTEETLKETPKTEEAPKEETKKAEAPKTKKAEGSIDIVKVRALLATKVGDHRTEIKNELTKLGATSVSTLDAEHYQAFADFLNSL